MADFGAGEQIFFIYDHTVLQKEEDDIKDAIIYFHPSSVPENLQCHLCGQLMGMTNFFSEFSGSPPSHFQLKYNKFAVRHIDKYSFALGGQKCEPDTVLHRQLDNLFSLLTFYHHNIQNVLQGSYSGDKTVNKSVSTQNVWDLYLSIIRHYGDILATAFHSMPWQEIPKSSPTLFLKSSYLLQNCQKVSGVIAGCIFFKNRIIVSQLPMSVTSKLLVLKPQQTHLPCETINTEFRMPAGVRILRVYVTYEEYVDLSPTRVSPKTGTHTQTGGAEEECEGGDQEEEDHLIETVKTSMDIIDNSVHSQEYNASENLTNTLYDFEKSDILQKSQIKKVGLETVKDGGDAIPNIAERDIHMRPDTIVLTNHNGVGENDSEEELGRSSGQPTPELEPLPLLRIESENPNPLPTSSDSSPLGDENQTQQASVNIPECRKCQTNVERVEHVLISKESECTCQNCEKGPDVKESDTGEHSQNMSQMIHNDLGDSVKEFPGRTNEVSTPQVINKEHLNSSSTSSQHNLINRQLPTDNKKDNGEETRTSADIKSADNSQKQQRNSLKASEFNSVMHTNNAHISGAGRIDTVDGDTPPSQSGPTTSPPPAKEVEKTLKTAKLFQNLKVTISQTDAIEKYDSIMKSVSRSNSCDLDDRNDKVMSAQPFPLPFISNVEKNQSSDSQQISKDGSMQSNYYSTEKSLKILPAAVSSQDVDIAYSTPPTSPRLPQTHTPKKKRSVSFQDSDTKDGNDSTYFSKKNYKSKTKKKVSQTKQALNEKRHVINSDRVVDDNVVDLDLYTQANSDMLLLLLMDRDSANDPNTVKDLWRSALPQLGELDVLVKEHADPTQIKQQGENNYFYLNFDSTQNRLTGNAMWPITSPENEFTENAVFIHETFNRPHSNISEMSLRSSSSCIYGHQGADHEVYYQSQVPVRSAVLGRDTKPFPDAEAKQNLAKDHNITIF